MNIVWVKLFYRVQTLFVFLQKKMIAKKLGLLHSDYRIDLLRTMQSIRGSVETADILIDIGANQGDFSKIFADIYHPSFIICIEPNSELNNDITANTKASKTVIVNKAISVQSGEMDFYFHSDTQMSSLFSSDSELIKKDFGEDDPEKTVIKKILVTTLDHVFEKYSVDIKGKSIFLKIDTQGNELEVIRSAANTMQHIQYCLLEYMFQTPYEKRYDFYELVFLMGEHGFSCLGPMHASFRSNGQVGAVLFLFEKTKGKR